jgi:hypothetical protein
MLQHTLFLEITKEKMMQYILSNEMLHMQSAGDFD